MVHAREQSCAPRWVAVRAAAAGLILVVVVLDLFVRVLVRVGSADSPVLLLACVAELPVPGCWLRP